MTQGTQQLADMITFFPASGWLVHSLSMPFIFGNFDARLSELLFPYVFLTSSEITWPVQGASRAVRQRRQQKGSKHFFTFSSVFCFEFTVC